MRVANESSNLNESPHQNGETNHAPAINPEEGMVAANETIASPDGHEQINENSETVVIHNFNDRAQSSTDMPSPNLGELPDQPENNELRELILMSHNIDYAT